MVCVDFGAAASAAAFCAAGSSEKAAAAKASRSAGGAIGAATLTEVLQAGHRTLLPASSSLTTSTFWHLALGHFKRMVISAQRSEVSSQRSEVGSQWSMASFTEKPTGCNPWASF